MNQWKFCTVRDILNADLNFFVCLNEGAYLISLAPLWKDEQHIEDILTEEEIQKLEKKKEKFQENMVYWKKMQ